VTINRIDETYGSFRYTLEESFQRTESSYAVYLKTGNSCIAGHGQLTTAANGVDMARQASIVVEMIKRYYPEAVQSKAGLPDMHIPE
jgi:hypothetical protein